MAEPGNDIRYLTREQIDTDQWDSCIRRAVNGLIYARSYYLDAMAKNWSALVMDDYETVMPLTWNRKCGFTYLYQPAFTAQLGIFTRAAVISGHSGRAVIPDSLIEAFLSALGRHFRFAEIFLNYSNAHPLLKPHANFILPLHAPYGKIASLYKQDLIRNLKAAGRSSFQYTQEADLRKTLSVYKNLYQHRMPHIKEDMYSRFEKLCVLLQKRGQLLLRAVTGPGNEVLATALLPRDERRVYLIQSSVTAAGRATEANHFLLDSLIRELAGQPLTLDFEGSELPGVAHFYRNFGASQQPFYFYRMNRLPWLLRPFKSK